MGVSETKYGRRFTALFKGFSTKNPGLGVRLLAASGFMLGTMAATADDLHFSRPSGSILVSSRSHTSYFVDLAPYLPSGSNQVTTITSPIEVTIHYQDDAIGIWGPGQYPDGVTNSGYSITPTGFSYPFVYADSTFMHEEYQGYSGSQQMFVDVFKRDFVRISSTEGESANITLLLPDGSSVLQSASSYSKPTVRNADNSVVASSWYTSASQHYSCAVLNAHYCNDSIHDYYTKNREYYWTDYTDNSAYGDLVFNVDPTTLGSSLGFWMQLDGNYGDMNISSAPGLVFTSVTTAVPEPEAWGLMLSGLVLVGAMARRRNAEDKAVTRPTATVGFALCLLLAGCGTTTQDWARVTQDWVDVLAQASQAQGQQPLSKQQNSSRQSSSSGSYTHPSSYSNDTRAQTSFKSPVKCLEIVARDSSGAERGFYNRCAFPVQFSYCSSDQGSGCACKTNPASGVCSNGIAAGGTTYALVGRGTVFTAECKGSNGEVSPFLTNGNVYCR